MMMQIKIFNQFQQEVASYVNLIINQLPATESRVQQDPVCQKVMSYCKVGWPDKSKLQGSCKQYATVMYKLSVVHGLPQHCYTL